VRAIGEAGEAVDQVGLAEAQAEDPALGAIEARAGDGDAMVEAFGEVTKQGGAGAAEVGLGEALVELGLGGESLKEFGFVYGRLVSIEIQQVVDAKAVGGGDEAVCGYVFL